MKRKNPVSEIVVLSNPRGRRRKRSRGYHVRRRRNPIGGAFLGNCMTTLKEGAIGAGGALANDAVFGFAKKFLPDALTTGYGRTGVKLGLACVTGFLANMIFRGSGRAVAAGAATVVLHEVGTQLINQAAPMIPLGAYEDVNLLGMDSAETVGAYMGAGAYMQKQGAVGDLLPQ